MIVRGRGVRGYARRRGVGAATVVGVSETGANTCVGDCGQTDTPADWFARNFDAPLTCAQMRAMGADLAGTECAAAGGASSASMSKVVLIAAAALFLGVVMGR